MSNLNPVGDFPLTDLKFKIDKIDVTVNKMKVRDMRRLFQSPFKNTFYKSF